MPVYSATTIIHYNPNQHIHIPSTNIIITQHNTTSLFRSFWANPDTKLPYINSPMYFQFHAEDVFQSLEHFHSNLSSKKHVSVNFRKQNKIFQETSVTSTMQYNVYILDIIISSSKLAEHISQHFYFIQKTYHLYLTIFSVLKGLTNRRLLFVCLFWGQGSAHSPPLSKN